MKCLESYSFLGEGRNNHKFLPFFKKLFGTTKKKKIFFFGLLSLFSFLCLFFFCCSFRPHFFISLSHFFFFKTIQSNMTIYFSNLKSFGQAILKLLMFFGPLAIQTEGGKKEFVLHETYYFRIGIITREQIMCKTSVRSQTYYQ